MWIKASAPGKLVLLGEYAVLHGAPAVVMAVDRRAAVRLEPSREPCCSVYSRSGAAHAARFNLTAGRRMSWLTETADSAARFALLTEIVHALCAEEDMFNAAALPAFTVNLDTRKFFRRASEENFDKLGLGSSAALTVALASALAVYAGHAAMVEDRGQWLVRLYALHRHFQRGQGSGLDVAASLYGGLIRYRLAASPAAPVVAPLSWPCGLCGVFVWSGRSASTRRLLEQVNTWYAQACGADVLMAELVAAAAAGARAAEQGDAAALVEAAANYGELLGRLGEASGADIVSAEHRAIAKLARRAGAAYKPCGAGGGDIGAAFTAEPERARYLSRSLIDGGYTIVPLRVEPAGLTIQTNTE